MHPLLPLLPLLLLAGCPSGDDTGKADDTGLGSEAVAVCTPSHTDGYELGGLSVADDALTINVSYGGGCEEHDWQLCWDGSFLESDPVQATLLLGHDAHDDSCEAYLTEDLVFGLVPLKTAWQEAYHSDTGSIVLRLDEQSASYPF